MSLFRPEDRAGGIVRKSERNASPARHRSKLMRRRSAVEHLESRCLLAIYNPVAVALSPSPVEGSPLAPDIVLARFADLNPAIGLSATVSFNGGSPIAANLVPSGSELVPIVGAVPQYLVELPAGSFTPTQAGASALNYLVEIDDSLDATSSSVVGGADVQNAPPTLLGAVGGIAATAGSPIVDQQVAVFADPSPGATGSSFIGTLDWGDGTPQSPATIIPLGGGQFSVEGSHTYAKPLTTVITFRVHDIDGSSIVGHTGTVIISDAPIDTPAPIGVSGMQGQLLNNVPLLTFVSHNPLAPISSFTAQIDWGDGGTSIGVVTRIGGGLFSSNFLVTGSHTYTSTADSPFTITLSVSDVFGGSLPPQTTTASIIQSPLGVSVLSLSANVSTPAGAGSPLAIVTDASGSHPLAGYTATIDWGDGTPDSTVPGTSFTAGPGGTLSVPSPGHTYARPGLFPITVTVTSADDAVGSGGGFASVNAPTVSINPIPVVPIFSVEGQPLPAGTSVAHFVIGAPGVTTSGLSAVIDWGDGSPTSLGTIALGGSSPSSTTFDVKGSHVYARPGLYTITTTFTDADHNTATEAVVANVVPALLTSGQGVPVAGAVQRTLINVPVATFVDPNLLSRASGIAATIDWGDGTASTGTVTAIGSLNNGVLFSVSGTHVYNAASAPGVPFAITAKVVKASNNTNTLTIASTATVAQSTLTVAAFPAIAVAGNPASLPANTIIAVFTDSRGQQAASSYKATISWGDGRLTSPARIASLGGGAFAVLAGHTYRAQGAYSIRVNVQGVDSLTHSTRTGYGASLATVTPGAGAVRAAIKAQRRAARHRHR